MQQLCQEVNFTCPGAHPEHFDANGDLVDEQTSRFLEMVVSIVSLPLYLLPNQLNLPEEIRFEQELTTLQLKGHNGKLPMDVTVSEDRIEKLKLILLGESSGIADVGFHSYSSRNH